MGKERKITHTGCHVAGRVGICQSDWHLLCKPVPCDQDRGGEVDPGLGPQVFPMEPSRISHQPQQHHRPLQRVGSKGLVSRLEMSPGDEGVIHLTL